MKPSRDLQTEWEPTTFAWKLIHVPPQELWSPPGAWCGCLGPKNSPRPELGLCPCDYRRKFGVEYMDRVLLK